MLEKPFDPPNPSEMSGFLEPGQAVERGANLKGEPFEKRGKQQLVTNYVTDN